MNRKKWLGTNIQCRKWKIEISADLIAIEKIKTHYEQYGNGSLNKMMNLDKRQNLLIMMQKVTGNLNNH